MGVKVRFEFISSGFRKILKSEGVAVVVDEAGEKIANRATTMIPYEGSEGYKFPRAWLGYGGGRVGGYVAPEDYLARLAEANQKVLSKAVNSL